MPQSPAVSQSAPAEVIIGCNLGWNGYTSPDQTKPQMWAFARNVFSGAFGYIQRCRFANVVTPSQSGQIASLKYFALPGVGAYLMADVAGKLFSYETVAYAETQRLNPYVDPSGAGDVSLDGPWMRESLQNILYEMNGQVKQSGRLANAATIEAFGLDAPDSSPQVVVSPSENKGIVSIARSAGVVTATLAGNLDVPGGNGIGMVNVTGCNDATFNGSFVVTGGSGTSTLTWAQFGQDTTSSAGHVDTSITKAVGRSYSWAWENANKPHVGAPSPATQYVDYQQQNGAIQLVEPGTVIVTSGNPVVTGVSTYFTQAWVGRSLWVSGLGNLGRIISVASATSLTLATAPASSTSGTSVGPNGVTVGAGVVVSGSSGAWANPTNLTLQDGSYATATSDTTKVSDLLAGKTLGFAVPSGAVITGVLVELYGHQDHVGLHHPVTPTATFTVSLTKNGTAVAGTPKTGSLGLSDSYVSFGGTLDSWGVPLLGVDVNATGFGVLIQAQPFETGPATTFSLDFARVTVTYGLSRFQVFDPQSTNIRFYETADGGATYFRTQRNAWDSSQLTLIASGLQFFDNANSEPPDFPFTTEVAQLFNLPPPVGQFIGQYQGRLIVFGVPGAGQSFFYSNSENTSAGMPQESYSPLNQATLPMQNAALNGYLEFPGSAIFWSDKQDMFRMTGLLVDQSATGDTAPQQGASITRLPYGLGAASPFACAMTPLGGIWLTSNSEIWLFTDRYAPRNIGRPVQDILDSIDPAQRGLARAKYYHTGTRNWFVLAIPSDGAQENNRLLVLDLDLLASNGSPSYFTFDMATNHPSWWVFDRESPAIEVVHETGGVVRLLAGQTTNIQDVDYGDNTGLPRHGEEIEVDDATVTLHAWGNDSPFIIKRPSWFRFNTSDAPKMLARDGWSFQCLGIDDDVYTFEHPLELDLLPGVNDSSTLCGNPLLAQGESFRHSPEMFRVGAVNFVAGRRLKFVINFPALVGVDWRFRSVQLGFGPTPPR